MEIIIDNKYKIEVINGKLFISSNENDTVILQFENALEVANTISFLIIQDKL